MKEMENKVTPGKVNVFGANHIGGISGEIWRREKERERELGFREMMSWPFRKRSVVPPYRKPTIYI